IVKCPSSPVWVCPNCVGAAEPAAHRVTIDLASGAPPTNTWPAISAANIGKLHNTPNAVSTQTHQWPDAFVLMSVLHNEWHVSERCRYRGKRNCNCARTAHRGPQLAISRNRRPAA